MIHTYTGAENLDVMGQMSHYNRWIYETVLPDLGTQVLEAGCGNGNITRFILKSPNLKRYCGVDMSPEFCRSLSTLIPSRQKDAWSFHAMNLEDPDFEGLARPSFDTIVCLNVLEHIEKDKSMLRRFYSMLEPGGKLILQVPAFQWLYGTIDKIDHHFRRYTKSQLTRQMKDAGFSISRAFYFNFAGIPAWFWHGRIRRLMMHPPSEMRLWDKAVPILRRVESVLPLPAGLSVIAVGKRI